MDKDMIDGPKPVPEAPSTAVADGGAAAPVDGTVPEQGGRAGPEPTRYGDWEVKGIAVDF